MKSPGVASPRTDSAVPCTASLVRRDAARYPPGCNRTVSLAFLEYQLSAQRSCAVAQVAQALPTLPLFGDSNPVVDHRQRNVYTDAQIDVDRSRPRMLGYVAK